MRANACRLRLLLVERKFVQSDLGGLLACTDLKIIDFHWISLHFCVFQLALRMSVNIDAGWMEFKSENVEKALVFKGYS